MPRHIFLGSSTGELWKWYEFLSLFQNQEIGHKKIFPRFGVISQVDGGLLKVKHGSRYRLEY